MTLTNLLPFFLSLLHFFFLRSFPGTDPGSFSSQTKRIAIALLLPLGSINPSLLPPALVRHGLLFLEYFPLSPIPNGNGPFFFLPVCLLLPPRIGPPSPVQVALSRHLTRVPRPTPIGCLDSSPLLLKRWTLPIRRSTSRVRPATGAAFQRFFSFFFPSTFPFENSYTTYRTGCPFFWK